MKFIVLSKVKVIFGWSAKCGCSHVKRIIHFFQNGKTDNKIHTNDESMKLPIPIPEDYQVIIFIRNPYHRLVSGFIDKYAIGREFHSRWPEKTKLTFTNFVKEVFSRNTKVIEWHHFTPQLSEYYNDSVGNHTKLKIFDITNIDYSYLETLFGKTIPDQLLTFRGLNQIVKSKTELTFNNPIYELPIEEYSNSDIDYYLFYNDELKQKVYEFYKKDFLFFKRHGFDYSI